MLNFEANHNTDDYSTDAEALSAYQNALLNLKNFTAFRGRLYQRDRATQLAYTWAGDLTLAQNASAMANGEEQLAVDWGTNKINITSTPDFYYATTDQQWNHSYVSVDLMIDEEMFC
jgi:hypothetical protein